MKSWDVVFFQFRCVSAWVQKKNKNEPSNAVQHTPGCSEGVYTELRTLKIASGNTIMMLISLIYFTFCIGLRNCYHHEKILFIIMFINRLEILKRQIKLIHAKLPNKSSMKTPSWICRGTTGIFYASNLSEQCVQWTLSMRYREKVDI